MSFKRSVTSQPDPLKSGQTLFNLKDYEKKKYKNNQKDELKNSSPWKMFHNTEFLGVKVIFGVTVVPSSPPEEPLPFRGGAVVQPPCDGVAQVGGSGGIRS